jgi:hypothetical protein
MAIVQWEKHYFGVGQHSWVMLEIQDANNSCRRLHWSVAPGYRLSISVPALNWSMDVENPADAPENLVDEWAIPGNIRLVENTDDPQDPYLEFPHPYTVQVRSI